MVEDIARRPDTPFVKSPEGLKNLGIIPGGETPVTVQGHCMRCGYSERFSAVNNPTSFHEVERKLYRGYDYFSDCPDESSITVQ